jgi:S-adenosylmethionine hydrolase
LNALHNVTNWESINFPDYVLKQKEFLKVFTRAGFVKGQVYYTDDAGNAITNIHRAQIESIFKEEKINISFGGTTNILRILNHPGEVGSRSYVPFAIYNEFDYLVIGFKYNNFAKLFDVQEGHEISITLRQTS